MENKGRERVACRLAAIGVAVMAAVVVVSPPAGAASPKRILVLQGEAPGLPGPKLLFEQFESTLTREFASPVEIFYEVLDTARFTSEAYQERLAALYAEKYGGAHPVDLVVAFTSPAVDFVLRHRNKAFADVPVLFGLIDRRFLEDRAGTSNTSAVFVQIDPSATLRLALSLYPRARKVIVVGGVSKFDREWIRVVRAELQEFGPRIPVEYDTNSRIEDLAWMVGTLSPDTIVLFVSMTRDTTNTPVRPTDVLERMRQTARVPIFGLSTTYLGHGIVGGGLLDFGRHGTELGRQAVRLLRGEAPVQTTTPPLMAVDWREMQRFGMSAVALPPSTLIAFREPGLWEKHKGTVIGFSLVFAAEGALIIALVWLVRRRRATQQLLQQRLDFQEMTSAVSVSLTEAAPAQIDAALDTGLRLVAATAGMDGAWRWEPGDPADEGWRPAQPAEGGTASFDDGEAALPPTIRRRTREEGIDVASALVVPVFPGALFWVSRRPSSSWHARSDELQMVSTMVSNVLKRRRAEASFEASDALKGAILDSLPAQVAVLDREGFIIAVNDVWNQFAREHGTASEGGIAPGERYVGPCVGDTSSEHPLNREARDMIESACSGERGDRQLEYQSRSHRWFLMRIEPLRRSEGGAVVTHTDITGRKTAEIALRESEERFRLMAEALPVAIWMADVDGGCTYFNSQWLQMTGRTLDQERGNGWLQSVHSEDRDRCMGEYLKACKARQRFNLEYRIKRHDGEYRWLLDIGMPRYADNGDFYGYIGGVVDLTERREAEQLLHDFNRKLIEAQEDERRHIARDLHDHLSQQLALLAIDIQQLSLNPPESVQALAAALQEQWRRTGEIASDVHAISYRLHPSKLESLGLAATIRAHCRDMSRHNLAVHFSEPDDLSNIPADVALCLFRIAEEALTNVARHSGATEAHVTLAEADGQITLRITDTGSGFRQHGTHLRGIGLVSMRERVQALGGTLTVRSAPGKGTSIEARVPETGQRQVVKHQPRTDRGVETTQKSPDPDLAEPA